MCNDPSLVNSICQSLYWIYLFYATTTIFNFLYLQLKFVLKSAHQLFQSLTEREVILGANIDMHLV